MAKSKILPKWTTHNSGWTRLFFGPAPFLKFWKNFGNFWNLGTWWILKFWGLPHFATTPKHVHEGEIPPPCELQHVTKDTYHCIDWFDTKIQQFTDRKLNQTLGNFSTLLFFFIYSSTHTSSWKNEVFRSTISALWLNIFKFFIFYLERGRKGEHDRPFIFEIRSKNDRKKNLWKIAKIAKLLYKDCSFFFFLSSSLIFANFANNGH